MFINNIPKPCGQKHVPDPLLITEVQEYGGVGGWSQIQGQTPWRPCADLHGLEEETRGRAGRGTAARFTEPTETCTCPWSAHRSKHSEATINMGWHPLTRSRAHTAHVSELPVSFRPSTCWFMSRIIFHETVSSYGAENRRNRRHKTFTVFCWIFTSPYQTRVLVIWTLKPLITSSK